MALTPKEVNGLGRVYSYEITHAAFFDGVDDYLTFTPTVAGDTKTFSFSTWVKLDGTENSQRLFTVAVDADNRAQITTVSGAFQFAEVAGGSISCQLRSSLSRLVDATGWYHLMVVVDTTQAVESDRIRLYVNGLLVTEHETVNYPVQDYETLFNTTNTHAIGSRAYTASELLNGYIAETHWIDGQALTPLEFVGISRKVAGLHVPKEYRGSHGANGFYLNYSDAADLGADVSGNGNSFAIVGGPIQVRDTPTDNFITLNPHVPIQNTGAYSSGNCIYAMTGTATSTSIPRGTIAVPTDKGGKFYVEGMITKDDNGSRRAFGFVTDPAAIAPHFGLNAATGGAFVRDGGANLFAHDFTLFDHFGIAMDFDAGKGWLHDETGWLDASGGYTGDPEAGDNPTFDLSGLPEHIYFVLGPNSSSRVWAVLNGGRTSFYYAQPEGFLPISTKNLPDPDILLSSACADIVLREATGVVTAIEPGFAPDFVNIKDRESAYSWLMFDSVRGANISLSTDTTAAEYDGEDTTLNLTSFDSIGYTLGDNGGVNMSGDSFQDLCLKAGIEQGFEIVAYTGDGVAGRTVSHNLGKAPTFMVVKRLDTAGYDWVVYHTVLGAGYYLYLNDPQAAAASNVWNSTEPTSTDFSVSGGDWVNADGGEYIAYLFTDSDIFKAFSYTGNGDADGPFVHLGGKPLALTNWKNTANSNANWMDYDTVRCQKNPLNLGLSPNSGSAEVVFNGSIATANGFKIIDSDSGINQSGALFIGLAILEAAHKYSTAF